MASESQYEQAVIALQGGLNFVDEALATSRGNLSNCLNFEVSDRLGYSRVLGDEKFDQGPYNRSKIYTNSVMIPGSDFLSFTVGEAVLTADTTYKNLNKTVGYFLGTENLVSGDSIILCGVVVVTDYKAFLSLISGVSILEGATSSATATFGNAIAFRSGTSALTSVEALNELFYTDNADRTAPNQLIGSALGNNPITGLHWYKGNEYAVTDYLQFNFTTGLTAVFAGDILSDIATGVKTSRVVDVTVATGTFEGGDAAGTILLKLIAGDPGGAMQVDRLGVQTPALTITGLSAGLSSGAGLWKSLDAGGWEEVNLGYEYSFSGGTSNGPPPVFERGEGNATVVPVVADSPPSTASSLGSWSLNGGATILECISTDDTKYVQHDSTAANPAVFIQVKDFLAASGIPADSEITGISLTINATGQCITATKFPYFLSQPFDNTGQLGTAKSTATLRTVGSGSTFTAADTFVLGGPTDLWGITDIRAALTNGFGFNLAPRAGVQGGNTVNFRINYVELSVYYSSSIDTYYFWNGVDDVQAPITNFYVDSGTWAGNDAHGRMQVASITPVSPATRAYIGAGDEIRTGAGGGGSLIAVVESAANYAYLPSLSALEENNSRYQMITANFYGNEDWETLYGVSGAGQAFAYDGFYFRRIYTGIAPDLDDPRHISYYQGTLALGYAAGNVTLSVPGNPENFSGVAGAVSMDTGDPVTGLLSLNGTSLGVFCRSSIGTIVGTSIDNYSYTIISPAEGAIEYTVQNMGEPVYCSNKGLTTLSQTAAYGDFLGNPLSYAVTPWLVPRIQQTKNPLADGFNFIDNPAAMYSSGVGILFATVCRSKNQYRLYFEDGSCLTMTLQGAQKEPVFTLQQADKWTMPPNREDATKYSKFIPLAASSVIDDDGRERIHMSHYNPTADAVAGQLVYYVYEKELSWTFCGMPIPYSLRLNENFLGNPFRKNTLSKIATHGLSMGYAPLRVAIGREYADPLTTERASPVINLPATPTAFLSQDLKPVMGMAGSMSAGEARSFNISLFNPLTGDGNVCPPFSVQMLLIQYKEGKGDV